MKDGGLEGLEARPPVVPVPPQLQFKEGLVKPPPVIVKPPIPVAVVPPKPPIMEGKTAVQEETASSRWNTKNLALRLGTDFISAASAAVMVAPIISIIDRYVPKKCNM